MAKKIKDSGSQTKRIRDTGPKLERVDPDLVGNELGAEPAAGGSASGANPVAFFALSDHLLSSLVSSGGRPGRRDATQRRKIPLTDEEWGRLKEVSQVMKLAGVNAAPGQVAGALLRQGIDQLQRESETLLTNDSEADETLDTRVERLMKAAASTGECPPGLKPVARELLRRMDTRRDLEGKG